MQYGSIGWSVGALLGYAQALKGVKRVIACIGDGSFQVNYLKFNFESMFWNKMILQMRHVISLLMWLLNDATIIAFSSCLLIKLKFMNNFLNFIILEVPKSKMNRHNHYILLHCATFWDRSKEIFYYVT